MVGALGLIDNQLGIDLWVKILSVKKMLMCVLKSFGTQRSVKSHKLMMIEQICSGVRIPANPKISRFDGQFRGGQPRLKW